MPHSNCFALLALLLVASAEVRADCGRDPRTLAEVLEQNGVFFVGRVTAAERGPYTDYPGYGDRKLTIRVLEWWAEPLSSEVTVFSSSPGGGYALDGIERGDVISVAPTIEDGKLVVGMCAPYTGPLSEDGSENVRPWLVSQSDIAEAIGPGSEPTEESRFGSSGAGWLQWAASGVGVALVALAVWYGRRGAT